jgi:zinc protease
MMARMLRAGRSILAFGVVSLFGAGFGSDAAAKVFDPETFTLANGMQVVVVNNPRAPIVRHMVWYRVGAADETPGKLGLAHYLEHLLFKGTREIPPGEFSKIVARNGGQDNAFTSNDYTAYFQDIARDRLEMVMRMEADRMVNLQLSDAITAPELKVVMEERRQRTDNNPGARLGEQMRAMLFVHHPYGTPVIGWMHEIEGLTTQDALDFYRRYYAPNNAILVVSGDITAKELKPLAEKIYGPLQPSKDLPPRRRITEPPTEGQRRITLADPQVQQPQWLRFWKAASYNHATDKERAYALDVAQTIMGGGASSRLYRALVVERKLAASVNVGYLSTALDLGTFSVAASPAPGVTLEQLEAAIGEELTKLLKDGVTAEEVQTAKTRLRRTAIFERDSLQGPALAFGAALTTGLKVEDVEAWPDRIAAVSLERVNEALRATLKDNDHVTGLLMPQKLAAAPSADKGAKK